MGMVARGLVAIGILMGVAGLPGSASATTFLYRFTPGAGDAGAFAFQADDAVPPLKVSDGTYFLQAISRGSGVFAGVTGVRFFNDASFGGLDYFLGPQLYTGPERAPALRTGSFMLENSFANYAPGSLTVSAVGSAVPEPATWLTMAAGFATLGLALRGRRRARVAVG